MPTTIAAIGFALLMGLGPVSAHDTAQDTLPDNYLSFTLMKADSRFEGASEYLEGFRITITPPADTARPPLDSAMLISLIRTEAVTGVLSYPNGKSTSIDFEVVDHRGWDDIYMKSTLGYFLWEHYEVHEDEITFLINWWYCPPATENDLRILEMASTLLADSSAWHQDDDRKCVADMDIGVWSLFCALKHASVSITGEYNHHNTAMQSVRSVIDEMVPNHDFAHTLMDFNNAPSTLHSDILDLLEAAKNIIRQELRRNDY